MKLKLFNFLEMMYKISLKMYTTNLSVKVLLITINAGGDAAVRQLETLQSQIEKI